MVFYQNCIIKFCAWSGVAVDAGGDEFLQGIEGQGEARQYHHGFQV